MFLLSASGRANRLAVSFVLCNLVFSALFPAVNAQGAVLSTPVQMDLSAPVHPVEIFLLEKSVETAPQNKTLIAHHESMGVGASQLLTTGVTTNGNGGLTKSLWANLILSMAYQQDAEMQAITKKMHRLGIATVSSIAAISGLTVAQSIDGLVTLQDDPHPLHPPILGLIGSSLTLATIGTQAMVGHCYKKQLMARQHTLQDEVLHIMSHLKNDGVSDSVKSDLSRLIGSEAMEEFMQIWTSVYH